MDAGHNSPRDREAGYRLAEVTLGMDGFYRKGLSSDREGVLNAEGLVPINRTDIQPPGFSGWADAQRALDGLKPLVAAIDDEARRLYLVQSVLSLEGMCRWFSSGDLAYQEKVVQLIHVPAEPVADAVVRSMWERLGKLLEDAGYRGSLKELVPRWEEDHAVPKEQVAAVLGDLLDEAQDRTNRLVLPLPGRYEIEPVPQTGVPYTAYCDYAGSKMCINVDVRFTRGALKHLVTHEAFPGHHTHMAVREHLCRVGEMPVDALLVVTNSASSATFEGIGDNGIYFLDWVEDIHDQIALVLTQLRSAASINAALSIHVWGASDREATRYLKEVAFGQDGWIRARLAFFRHRLRAPFIFSYWYGYRAVADVFARVDRDRRGDFYRYLYSRMHSPQSLAHFIR